MREQREIKFRVWNKSLKKFADSEFVYMNGFGKIEINGKEVNYLEIQMYTGLKDKNGKEIYEGDVFRTINHYEGKKPVYLYHSVVWRNRLNGWFCLNANDKTEKEQDGSCQLWVYIKNSECEIIGNIYENPELLESKKTD